MTTLCSKELHFFKTSLIFPSDEINQQGDKMKTTLLVLSLALASIAQANTTRILHLDSPELMNEPFEVLTSGSREVIKVNANNLELIEKLHEASETNELVELEYKNNELSDLTVLENNKNDEEDPIKELHPMINYTPTNLSSYDQVADMFKTLNKRTKMFSQCFNRAHIWAKQLSDNFQVDSMKILIYYTKRFRREISGKWWFHIAPMVQVGDERLVLDREFTRKPVTDQKWQKIFTRKMEKKGIYGYKCKVIKNIKEFYDRHNQENEFCNIQVTSMYYWEPNDMSRLDKKGTQKTKFLNRELRIASKEAFKKWRRVYKKLKVK